MGNSHLPTNRPCIGVYGERESMFILIRALKATQRGSCSVNITVTPRYPEPSRLNAYQNFASNAAISGARTDTSDRGFLLTDLTTACATVITQVGASRSMNEKRSASHPVFVQR